MQPLLKIETVPINIEYKVTRASLQPKSDPPRVDITRNRGSLNLQTTPGRLTVDTYEARASTGIKSAIQSIEEFGSKGRRVAMEATRSYVENGNALMDGRSITDIAASKAFPPPAETMLDFIPSAPPEISYEPGSVEFDVEVDELNFDWDIHTRPQMEYVPGGIEFSITQYNDVIIEYMGSPIYVPPSADPNYQPPPNMDVNA